MTGWVDEPARALGVIRRPLPKGHLELVTRLLWEQGFRTYIEERATLLAFKNGHAYMFPAKPSPDGRPVYTLDAIIAAVKLERLN